MRLCRLLMSLLIVLIGACHHTLHANKKAAIATVSLSVSAVGIYGFYKWLKNEEQFSPTIENLNTLTFKPITSEQLTMRPLSHESIPRLSIDELVTRINKNKTPPQAIIPLPTQQHANNSCTSILVEQGIADHIDDPVIFIFSRGYARTNTPGTNDNALQKGGCAMAAYLPIQDNIINNAPCITFDYPDRRRCFNFGQKKDVHCLRFIYEQTLKTHPHAQIILIGDCRGARAIVNFATERPKNVKALVLLSPFFSAQQLTQEVAYNYLSWLPGSSSILQNFFQLWFPNYTQEEDTRLAQHVAQHIYDIPIFIAHRNKDTLVSTAQVRSFVDHLTATQRNKTHLIITDDTSARHSRLTPVKEIQKAVNQFFYTYNLPHNPELLHA